MIGTAEIVAKVMGTGKAGVLKGTPVAAGGTGAGGRRAESAAAAFARCRAESVVRRGEVAAAIMMAGLDAALRAEAAAAEALVS